MKRAVKSAKDVVIVHALKGVQNMCSVWLQRAQWITHCPLCDGTLGIDEKQGIAICIICGYVFYL